MEYKEYSFSLPASVSSFGSDVLPGYLADLGFESFSSQGGVLLGYLPSPFCSESGLRSALDAFSLDFGLPSGSITFSCRAIADQDWNKAWEDSFSSLTLAGGRVAVRTSSTPPTGCAIEAVIDPCQSFGTGSHETTSLMVDMMVGCDFSHRTALDVGCGTAVLSIIASKLGADRVFAFDIDRWAYQNALKNVSLNGLRNIDVRLGGFEVAPQATFDFVLANITRNILLQGLPTYARCCREGGSLLMSGFLSSDIGTVSDAASASGFSPVGSWVRNGWAAIMCRRTGF